MVNFVVVTNYQLYLLEIKEKEDLFVLKCGSHYALALEYETFWLRAWNIKRIILWMIHHNMNISYKFYFQEKGMIHPTLLAE